MPQLQPRYQQPDSGRSAVRRGRAGDDRSALTCRFDPAQGLVRHVELDVVHDAATRAYDPAVTLTLWGVAGNARVRAAPRSLRSRTTNRSSRRRRRRRPGRIPVMGREVRDSRPTLDTRQRRSKSWLDRAPRGHRRFYRSGRREVRVHKRMAGECRRFVTKESAWSPDTVHFRTSRGTASRCRCSHDIQHAVD
jgi:hypothetical protein